ncbi:TAXI family TRAP transporter solute-binding subunit [Limisalsivibrio acetivorans]|uniref:TAXI family TRAP transporter solute-binding subunit n=1 Tax=Limisalsivibrio acetivorans TaxID=1304888 RepID=UPI0003B5601D|nr:TAXI family TRAP transporter solute-binding subunit [Limisalsivibrio acetivorans]
MKRIGIITLALLFALAVTPIVQARTFVTIGTGGVTGVYYPTGGAISRIINKKSKEYGIKATVESTGGSVYNINAVLTGDLEFGIAQSDRQYQAVHGTAEWQNRGAQEKLRSVFSIHPESITLIAAADSGVTDVKSLKGKRVNIGNPGSGQLQNSKDVLGAFGLSEESVDAEYVKAVEAPGLLQDERLDAFFYTVGHPNGNISEATSGRIKVSLIPIVGSPVDELIAKHPYYAKSVIDIKNYPTAINEKDVESVGVKATLVTSADVSDDVVYAITKEVFENFEEFKKLHPAYSVLTKKDMLAGMSAPVHPGALKYYKESGLVEYVNKDLIK